VKSTADNLQAAIDGEAGEFKEMYPGFLAAAEAEGNTDAARSFANAMAVERIHHDLYAQALDSLKAGNDMAEDAIFVCGICGNTVLGAPPEECPICGALKTRFSQIA
jgi:rubrerythrin